MHELRQAICLEKSLEMACVGLQIGWDEVSENQQGRVNIVSQVDMHPPAGSGGLSKGTMASASTSVWEKAAPLALSLKPDNSVPPHMSLVPFELLPQCQSSEGVSLSKSVCWPFKRNAWDSKSPVSLSHSPCWFLQPEVMGTYLPGTGTLGWGPGVGLGLLTPNISLLNFYLPHVCVGPAHFVSAHLLPVWMDVVSLILQSPDFHSA